MSKYGVISGPYSPVFGLNTGKYGPEITPYLGTFHAVLTANPPINICISRINNRLFFKIKDGYKLELQTPETMKLIDSNKKLIGKAKNGENVPSLRVVEVVIVQQFSTVNINKSLKYHILLRPINLCLSVEC